MNIYSHPEKFGLEIIATLETGEAYEFDTTILFRDGKGMFFALHDSGCSCPIPFEDLGVNDLIPINHKDELRRFVVDQHRNLFCLKAEEFLNKYPAK